MQYTSAIQAFSIILFIALAFSSLLTFFFQELLTYIINACMWQFTATVAHMNVCGIAISHNYDTLDHSLTHTLTHSLTPNLHL